MSGHGKWQAEQVAAEPMRFWAAIEGGASFASDYDADVDMTPVKRYYIKTPPKNTGNDIHLHSFFQYEVFGYQAFYAELAEAAVWSNEGANLPFYNVDRNDAVNLTSTVIEIDPNVMTAAGTVIEVQGGTSAFGGQTLSGLWVLNYDYNYTLTVTTVADNNRISVKFLDYGDYTKSSLTEAQA